MAERYVLDTSALLALRSDEPGADLVEAILAKATAKEAQVLVSFVTRMEVLYRVEADEGFAAAVAAIRLLDATAIEWVSCEPAILERAASIKAAGGLSLADSWIAATSLDRNAVLVHRDPEFERVGGLTQQVLPKKTRG